MRQLIVILSIAAACLGCDPLANPEPGRLSFSSDTISFDTVFSAVGSTTMEFRAINSEREPLLIDRIWLGGGNDSPFRLNINGKAGTEARDVVLGRGDSLFVFVEVTIDPTGEDLPVYIVDSVSFISGSFAARVILEAWGQDIRIIDEDIYSDTDWTDGKPYVIKGSLFIDTLASLTLNPGTRVYMHKDGAINVAGTLHSSGIPGRRVIIATDRLEDVYEDVPGRWKGICFLSCSKDNNIDFTDIRNAEMAVQMDGDEIAVPDLVMNGTMLMHNSVASLAAKNADVFAVNCLFAHSGFSTISLTEGGNYDFVHCTVAGRWEYGFRSEPAMFIGKGQGTLPDVTIVNSVITGNLDDELGVDASAAETALSLRADSSLIKVDTLGSSWYSGSVFRDVITGLQPRFIDEATYDFRPDTLSPLIDRAGRSEAALWPYDFRNKPRPTGPGSDIGAFERQPGEKRKDEI
jgi:hypothetical protein